MGSNASLFDTHSHLYDRRFDPPSKLPLTRELSTKLTEGETTTLDRDVLIPEIYAAGVHNIINIGADLQTTIACQKLAERYDFCHFTAGFHPHDAKSMTADALLQIERIAAHKKCLAIGEIGLDYHYDFSPRDVQKQVFIAQMELAKSLKMPVVIHSREATQDTIEVLKNYPQVKCVIHCFSGSVETAKIMLNMGHSLSFTGVLTFPNARQAIEVVKYAPIDRLMAETDSPYMAPIPFRGKRCDPSMVFQVVKKIAEIKGISFEQAAQITTQNAKTFFGVS